MRYSREHGRETLQSVWTGLCCSMHPLIGKGCVTIKLPNMVFGLDLLFALNNWAYVSDQSRTCIIDGYKQRPKLYIMTQIKKYIKEHTHHITYIDHPRSKIYQWNLCVYDLLLHESRCSIFADIILKSMNDCTGWILGYPWKQGRQRTTPSSKTLILSRS